MGVCQKLWTWFQAALGSSIPRREFVRFYRVYGLLHYCASLASYVAGGVTTADRTADGFTTRAEDSIFGDKVGPLGITHEQMTDEVWDYIFANGEFPAASPIPLATVNILKAEFSYFYPLDIRSSGKDLIPNHLSFCIYVHSALFAEEHWPLSMRANGHLLLNGEKMSKSTGNSLTLKDSLLKFGADATRVTLADGGDSIEDANFEEATANAAILRLRTLIEWSDVRQ